MGKQELITSGGVSMGSIGSSNPLIFGAVVTKMQHMLERKNLFEQKMVWFGILNPSIENPNATTDYIRILILEFRRMRAASGCEQKAL